MCIELKIKSKHLSLESKVIRFEERKLQKQIKWLYENDTTRESDSYSVMSKSDYWKTVWKLGSLTDHRKRVVGNENRATFLARAYIEGVPYNKVETKRKDEKHYEFNCKVLPRVLDMVKKYHPVYEVRKNITLDVLKDWCNM